MKEADASFDISITPFAHFFFPGQDLVSSINLTFSTKNNNEANGFALFIISDIKNETICRIFDFRSSTEAKQTHVVLFHDRLSCLVESFMFDVTLVFRSFPFNDELSYYAFLPDVKSIESTSPCNWKPIIMLFSGCLSQNIIEVKFSQASSHLNISTYDVILTHVDKGEIDRSTVSANPNVDMLKTIFLYVNRGFYQVTVKPSVTFMVQCKGGVTRLFSIETAIFDTMTIVYICIIAQLGVILIIAIFFLLRWMYKLNPVGSQPLVLLVYSYDCPEHKVLINSFVKFLENQCNIKVVTLYGDTGNPETWIHEMFFEASVIMVILSDGLYHTIEKFNNPCLVEGHKWRRQLSSTMSFISKEIFYSKNTINRKKFCKVSFSYLKTPLEPKSLTYQPWGNCYVIPRDNKKLLCYIFDTTRNMFCFKLYPLMPGHNVASSPDGKSLIKCIKDMKPIVDSKQNLKFEEEYHPDFKNVSEAKKENLQEQNDEFFFSGTGHQTCSRESKGNDCFWEMVIDSKNQVHNSRFQDSESEECLTSLSTRKFSLKDEDSFWDTHVFLKSNQKNYSSLLELETEKGLDLLLENKSSSREGD